MNFKNFENYRNKRISFDFLDKNRRNKDISYYLDDEENLKVIKERINFDYNLTFFQKYCMKQYVSFNEAQQLFRMKFGFDWSDYIYKDYFTGVPDYNYYDYDLRNNYKEPRLHYKVYTYKYSEDSVNFESKYSLRDKNNIDEYFTNEKSPYYRYAPNCWTVIKWLIDQDKLTIIDNNDHIMFYFNNMKKFHLERSSDLDVCFYKKNFEEAINIIFKKFNI